MPDPSHDVNPFPASMKPEALTLNAEVQRRVDELVSTLALNMDTSRSALLERLMDPRRDIAQECGYPETKSLDAFAYRQMYDREPIATRVVEYLPKEVWQVSPTMYEDEDAEGVTALEEAWDELGSGLRGKSWYKDEEGSPVWNYLCRAQIAARIAHYGVLLMGFDDGQELWMPVAGAAPDDRPGTEEKPSEIDKSILEKHKPTQNMVPAIVNNFIAIAGKPEAKTTATVDYGVPTGLQAQYDAGLSFSTDEIPERTEGQKLGLIYLRVFDESLAQIVQYERNHNSPRFGQPVRYLLTLNDPNEIHGGTGLPQASLYVHWSRVIHVPGNLGTSEIFSIPPMRSPWNRLCDLYKTYGGSSEMHWRAAFPGLSFETHPQLGGDAKIDPEKLKEQIYKYFNSLSRVLATKGMTVKSLAPQTCDAAWLIDALITAVCIVLAVPKRIFMGSERGELASSQDDSDFNDYLRHVQVNETTPNLIVPFIDRLIAVGVLPEPKDGYHIKWPDLDSSTKQQRAQIALLFTQAIAAYMSGNGEAFIAPMDYLTRVWQYTEEEAKSVCDAVKKHIADSYPDAEGPPMPGHAPKEPLPELPPASPVKMKDGEKLVTPDGKKLADFPAPPKPPAK